MVTDAKKSDQRLHQIQQYHQLHRYVKGAKIIHQAKKAFDLKGNFDDLELLLTAVSQPEKQ